MSSEGHVAELSRRHRDLEKQIMAEQSRNNRDQFKIVELKRKKLHVKEEIERLQH